jgi:cell wall-associated NlpC family hydrolase
VTPRQWEIVAQARTWLGTPYHHHGRVKGVGVDCAQILIAVFAAAGVIDEFDPGAYPRDWHLSHCEEIYARWLDKFGERVQTPAPGDVALYKFGRAHSHGGIVTPEGVIHSYIGRGVTLTRADEEPLVGRPVLYWKVRDGRQADDQHV